MKKTIKLFVLILGTLMMIYGVAMLFASGFGVGLVPIYVFSVILILYGIYFEKQKKTVHIAVVCIGLIIVSACAGLAIYGNNDDVSYNEDAVIVLGKGLEGDKVPPDLAYRLDKTIEYYGKNPDALIVVSGGMGTDEKISEALAMERYLVSNGISAEKIIKEDQSTSTYENFVFSSDILNQKFGSDYSVAFITNNFHVYRAERLAKSVGVKATHLGAEIEWYTVPTNYMRELLALAKLIVFKMT